LEKRTFGRTGLAVSVLGFGGAPIGVLKIQQDRIEKILNTLLDRGVNVIDTAAMYAGSEEAIGNAVAHRRNEYVLISKCGQAIEGLEGEAWSAQVITQTVDRALRRLKTDHLDVMLLHTCDLETLKKEEALGALVAAREAGKVQFVGYSGDNEAAVYAAEHPEISVLQTSLNICDQANLDKALSIALKNDVGVIVKRPIANAAWKVLSDQPGFYQTYAQIYTDRLEKMGTTPADLGFDGEPQAVWPEIALRFTLSIPGVHTAIIGTTNPEHVAANIGIAAKGPLPQKMVEELRQVFHRAESAAGETWNGLT